MSTKKTQHKTSYHIPHSWYYKTNGPQGWNVQAAVDGKDAVLIGLELTFS